MNLTESQQRVAWQGPALRRVPKAFTLIELLVVVSIIGLIAALALPALSRAKQSAKSASCRGNLRQLGIGIRAFADDNDGRFPVATNRLGSTFSGTNWATIGDAVRSYMPEISAILRCKADKQRYFEERGSSYEWNTALNGRLIDRVGGAPGAAQMIHAAWMMRDFKEWHSFKNAVFLDGHVDRVQ